MGHAVVVPVYKRDAPGVVQHLHAFVQVAGSLPASQLTAMVALKKELGGLLPAYMIPKVITFVGSIPLTANGKADRQALRALL